MVNTTGRHDSSALVDVLSMSIWTLPSRLHTRQTADGSCGCFTTANCADVSISPNLNVGFYDCIFVADFHKYSVLNDQYVVL
jgi:hypothetical protein